MTRGRLIAFAAAGLLVVTACGSGASEGASRAVPAEAASAEGSGGQHTVHLPKSYKFVPSSIEVLAGDEVTWVNEDDFPHTVQLLDEEGVDKKLGVGESTTIAFPRVGIYRYTCSLHPTQMNGEVVVKERPA